VNTFFVTIFFVTMGNARFMGDSLR
jgi:hypothetical protein